MELTVLDDFLQEQMKKESHSFKKKNKKKERKKAMTHMTFWSWSESNRGDVMNLVI